MKEDRADARPVPVPPSVRKLIREVAPEREDAPPLERRFTRGREEWVAKIVGEASAGSGLMGSAHLVAIRFEPLDDGETKENHERGKDRQKREAREVLIPRGRFEYLYDEELIELLDSAEKG